MEQRGRVLVVGGGVAALEAVLALQATALDRAAITLLAPNERFTYRPLAVAKPFGLGSVHQFELRSLLSDRGVPVVRDALAAVDPERRVAITASGDKLRYDVLVLCVGSPTRTALRGALTFGGEDAVEPFRKLLAQAERGALDHLVFAVPGGVPWALPLYELALMTAARLSHARSGTKLALVTPERAPLDVFGPAGTASVVDMLLLRDVRLRSGTRPIEVTEGRLLIDPGGSIPAGAVVALPRHVGPRIPGLPRDADVFLPTDPHGRVVGTDDVYAAGDATDFPLKQGGLATQQADAVAEAIAARLGREIDPRPFRPVLRGLLLTGRAPRYLRAEAIGATRGSRADDEAIWWPPAKIAGHHLAPFLALRGVPAGPPPGSLGIRIEGELSARG